MSEISREEFTDGMNRVYDKLDTIQTDVIATKVKLDLLDIPEQPCSELSTHLETHKEITGHWKHSVILGAVFTVLLFIQEPIKQIFINLFK